MTAVAVLLNERADGGLPGVLVRYTVAVDRQGFVVAGIRRRVDVGGAAVAAEGRDDHEGQEAGNPTLHDHRHAPSIG